MTGWGQTGPRAGDVGHDIDYIAVSGALHPIGIAGGPPVPPLNLVADFGGGGMLLVVGVLAALIERERSGKGQVVDAAMVDGSALLMAMHFGFLADGLWSQSRATIFLMAVRRSTAATKRRITGSSPSVLSNRGSTPP